MKQQALKFAAGITYYNPDEACLSRLRRYLDIFDMVFIYDNSEDNSNNDNNINNSTQNSGEIIEFTKKNSSK